MGEHAHPVPMDPSCSLAAAVAFGSLHSFSFAKAPEDSAEAARALAAGGSIVGNALAGKGGMSCLLGGSEGWLLAGNAKDVPGRGSRGWGVVRARRAAAA